MASTSKLFLAALVAVGTLLVATAAQAQQESLWRVESKIAGEAPPPYANNLSPFPIKQRPVEETVAVEEELQIDPQMAAEEQRKALQAAGLLSEIREILRDERAFSEDVSNINVQATARGPGGEMVLVNGVWRKLGDTMIVPIVSARRVVELLERLRGLDERLAQIVDDSVRERLEASGDARITISRVEAGRVIFVNLRGQEIVISYERSNW